jgi:SAM-dependent methyltransferase
MGAKYQLKFWWEWLSDTAFWGANDAAREDFGYCIKPEQLPLSKETAQWVVAMSVWHDTQLNWSEPSMPLEWKQDECDRFNAASEQLFETASRELGSDFELIYTQEKLTEDPDLGEYLKDSEGFVQKRWPWAVKRRQDERMTDSAEVTTRTYDRIVADFAEHNWDIRLVALENFCRLLQDDARVLDLGCGPGRDTMLLREQSYRVIGLDRSMGMLREARRRVGGPLLCGDMRHIPFASVSFDGVWLCAALLHLPKADALPALIEIRRLLRAYCPLYISVKQGDGESWTADHTRFFAYYQPDELSSIVKEAGYTVLHMWLTPQEQATWVNLVAMK